MTTTNDWLGSLIDNVTNHSDSSISYVNDGDVPMKVSPVFMFLTKWILRLVCILIALLCPWANFQLIQFFRTRSFYKDSSAKWYVIFKAVCDITYMIISVPIIFCLTYNIDIIHRNSFTCKLVTYVHYLSDDLISMLLTLLCMDRMLRITCGFQFRQRFPLSICITTVVLFVILNVHHIVRLQHQNGFCHKTYFAIWDYDFDIYYSLIYTSVTWTIIFITSVNLTVSVYCDRSRRIKLKQQLQQKEQQKALSNVFFNSKDSPGFDNDRVGLIDNDDDLDDAIEVTIEQNTNSTALQEKEKQDNIDLQITICVLIIAGVFLACNLPNFIIFIMRFIYNSTFSTIGFIFVYIAIFPLLFAHTIPYFIFNHLGARLFPSNAI